jgi:hypothetical protein
MKKGMSLGSFAVIALGLVLAVGILFVFISHQRQMTALEDLSKARGLSFKKLSTGVGAWQIQGTTSGYDWHIVSEPDKDDSEHDWHTVFEADLRSTSVKKVVILPRGSWSAITSSTFQGLTKASSVRANQGLSALSQEKEVEGAGDSRFNKDWVIVGDPALGRHMASPELTLVLAQFKPRSRPIANLSNGRLTIVCNHYPASFDDIRLTIEAGQELLRRIASAAIKPA